MKRPVNLFKQLIAIGWNNIYGSIVEETTTLYIKRIVIGETAIIHKNAVVEQTFRVKGKSSPYTISGIVEFSIFN